jgi:hypothetical protein
MTRRGSESEVDADRHEAPEGGYEPPTLVPLGNARHLLAANQGSVPDMIDPGETQPGG